MEVQEAGLGLIGWIVLFVGFYFVVDMVKGKKDKPKNDDKTAEEK